MLPHFPSKKIKHKFQYQKWHLLQQEFFAFQLPVNMNVKSVSGLWTRNRLSTGCLRPYTIHNWLLPTGAFQGQWNTINETMEQLQLLTATVKNPKLARGKPVQVQFGSWIRDYHEQTQRVVRAGLEPGISRSQGKCPNHWATLPPNSVPSQVITLQTDCRFPITLGLLKHIRTKATITIFCNISKTSLKRRIIFVLLSFFIKLNAIALILTSHPALSPFWP